jgi:hypothetical protein
MKILWINYETILKGTLENAIAGLQFGPTN